MVVRWQVLTVIMVGLLLLAGPMTPRQAVAQAPGVDKALSDASAAQDRAAKAYSDLMARLPSVKSMPNMDENEKALVAMLQQMTDSLKTLLDANKTTLDALKELRHIQK